MPYGSSLSPRICARGDDGSGDAARRQHVHGVDAYTRQLLLLLLLRLSLLLLRLRYQRLVIVVAGRVSAPHPGAQPLRQAGLARRHARHAQHEREQGHAAAVKALDALSSRGASDSSVDAVSQQATTKKVRERSETTG